MDAIKLLKMQHREVDELFSQFDESEDEDEKRELFAQIADKLAVHATIEERHFYPEVQERATADELAEAYDEHLVMKELILECMRAEAEPGFDGHVAALKGAVEHHVEEEETELFVKVQALFEPELLEAIGQLMEADADQLSEGEPRLSVQVKTEPPANALGA